MITISANYNDANFYHELKRSLAALVAAETDLNANLANISAYLFHSIPDLNWCGFYLWQAAENELVVGPFQGRPACTRIKSGRGVCGTAFASKTTLNVADVSAFPGHIACDSASRSELVIPILRKGEDHPFGVLDLDSPRLARFSEQDQVGLETVVATLF